MTTGRAGAPPSSAREGASGPVETCGGVRSIGAATQRVPPGNGVAPGEKPWKSIPGWRIWTADLPLS